MSLGAVTSIANKINGVTRDAVNGSLFNVKIPSNNVTQIMGLDGTNISSIGGAVDAVRKAAQTVVQGLRMAGCVVSTLANPKSALNVLNQIGGMLATYAIQFANDVVNAIGAQIKQLIAQSLGTAMGAVSAVFGLLTSIANLVDAIIDIFDNFKDLGFSKRKFWLDQEDCEAMFAMVAACYMNKLFGSKLEKFKQKTLDKITETGQDINQHLADELADVNTVSNYMQRESFMLNKATAQLRAASR